MPKAQQLAREAVFLNHERYKIEQKFFKEIVAIPHDLDQPILVFYIPNLHQGVISSLAGRLTSHLKRPVVILGDSEGGKISGSARSSDSTNLYEVFQQCSDLLIRFGGHSQALGVELELIYLGKFKERLLNLCSQVHERYTNEVHVDTWLSAKQFNSDLAKDILKLTPFGHGNPAPVFGIQNIELGEEPDQMDLSFQEKTWHAFKGRADIACSTIVDSSSRSVSFKIVDLKPRNAYWFQR